MRRVNAMANAEGITQSGCKRVIRPQWYSPSKSRHQRFGQLHMVADSELFAPATGSVYISADAAKSLAFDLRKLSGPTLRVPSAKADTRDDLKSRVILLGSTV